MIFEVEQIKKSIVIDGTGPLADNPTEATVPNAIGALATGVVEMRELEDKLVGLGTPPPQYEVDSEVMATALDLYATAFQDFSEALQPLDADAVDAAGRPIADANSILTEIHDRVETCQGKPQIRPPITGITCGCVSTEMCG